MRREEHSVSHENPGRNKKEKSFTLNTVDKEVSWHSILLIKFLWAFKPSEIEFTTALSSKKLTAYNGLFLRKSGKRKF